MRNGVQATITEHKIGKTTYLICAAPSEGATDTIDKKIEKLIMKDMRQLAESIPQ